MIAKVCGLTTPEDVQMALDSGADLLGFLRHPASPRHCPEPGLPRLAGERAVLVAVADGPAEILRWARDTGARWVQPYLPDRAGLAPLREAGLSIILPWPDEPGQAEADVDLYLWETSPKATGLPGGSGRGHAMAHPPPGPFLLAGGLDAEALAGRFAALPAGGACRGFDAASRLEDAPGRKDPAKVKLFVQAAHLLEVE